MSQQQINNDQWRKVARPWAYQFLYARFGGWTHKTMGKYLPALKWLKKLYFTDQQKFWETIHGTKAKQPAATGH